MEELSLHVLDIAENSIAAGARSVEIRIREDRGRDVLSVEIADDGRGMSQQTVEQAADPFFTTRTTRRVGLGLALLEHAATQAGGEFKIESAPGQGTRVTGVFRHSHPDRQPLGDIAQTLFTLAIGNPQTEFTYVHQSNDEEISFSTGEIKARLGDTPIHSPSGMTAVRKSLEEVREQIRRLEAREEGAHAAGNR